MDKTNINWEERRFLAAAIISAGIFSNYSNQVPSSFEIEKAVQLADSLISILSGLPLNSLSSELYQSKSI